MKDEQTGYSLLTGKWSCLFIILEKNSIVTAGLILFVSEIFLLNSRHRSNGQEWRMVRSLTP